VTPRISAGPTRAAIKRLFAIVWRKNKMRRHDAGEQQRMARELDSNRRIEAGLSPRHLRLANVSGA
jgi:hypothetical protein